MVDMDSPPKLVRKNRNKSNPIVPPSPMELIGKENSKQEMSNPNRSEHTNYRVPVSQTFHKRASNKGKDLAELLPTTSSPEASTLFYPRMDSVRSMNSRSVASHSTQAELDFYSQRKEYSSTVAAGVMAPPLWVASSSSKDNESAGANNSVAGTVHQRRRGMLAKSARMLRSHRPTWDRSESAHSFASQSSSAAWSLGGSTLGGISRASSRKSLHSWNTSSQPSRTSISPPDQARNTSSSTVGRPRRIVDDTGVTMHAHRPVPGQGGISRQATTPAPTTTTSYYPNVGDIYRYGRATERSLLEDDDDYNVMGNLLTTMSVMGGVGELDEDAESPSDEDEEDGDTVAALGGMWEPHPGSFVPYQRES